MGQGCAANLEKVRSQEYVRVEEEKVGLASEVLLFIYQH